MHAPRTRTRLIGIFVALALSLGVAAAPASAQQQNGLVNVAVVNNTVQVPIAVAANVCGLQVGILAQNLRQGPVTCTAVANAVATRQTGAGGGGTANQQGLVNIFIADNVIQVPVGVAANICGVQAGVLAQDLVQGPVTCNAQGNAQAAA
jgi:hypothetical protein